MRQVTPTLQQAASPAFISMIERSTWMRLFYCTSYDPQPVCALEWYQWSRCGLFVAMGWILLSD